MDHFEHWSLFSTLYILSDQSILYLVNNEMSDEHSDNEPKKKKKSSSSEMDELREVAEVLPELFGALNESIPKLISGLIGSVYSPEAAGNMAKGIGQFYSNLIAEGIPEEVALEMTKKFVGALDFSKLMNMVSDEASSSRGPRPPTPPTPPKKKRKRHQEEIDYDNEDEAFDEEFEE